MATAPSAIDVTAATDSGVSSTDDNTSNTTPVITGTGTPGDVITISSSEDGQLVGSVTIPLSGTWTFPVITPLSEGTHQLTVTAADDAAGTNPDSAPVFEITIDTTVDAPVITSFTTDTDNSHILGTDSDNITSDTAPVITGTTEDGSDVAVFIDGNPAPGTVVVTGTAWTYTHSGTPLAEGDNVITAQTTDVAGNVSALSTALTITVDTGLPASPMITDIIDLGVSDSDNVTSEDEQTINGTAEAGSTVEISVDGSVEGTVVADAVTGAWTFNYTFPTNTAETGVTHTVTALATDAAGNTSAAPGSYTFVLDIEAPNAPSITSISDDTSNAADFGSTGTDGITSDNAITITGTADDNSIIEVSIDGAVIGTTTADGNGDWTFDHTGTTLTDGDYTLTATATDLAGNTSVVSGDFDITVDTAADAAPTIDSLSADTGATGDGITSNGSTTISGSFVAGSTVAIMIDGTPAPGTVAYSGTTWTYTHNAPFGEGSYDITAQATDSAGNVSPASAVFTLEVDTTPPLAPTVSSISADTGSNTSDNVTMTGLQTISGTAEKGSTVNVLVDGTPVGTATADPTTGAWTVAHDFGTNPAANGTAYAITATATDAAGHTGPASPALNVTVDTTDPTASAIALDAGSLSPNNTPLLADTDTPSFTFTAESGAAIEIDFGDGNSFVSVGTGTGALQTVTIPAAYTTEGTKNVTLRATDLAGNTTLVGPVTLTVNLAPSAVTIDNNQVVVAAADDTLVGSVAVVDTTDGDTHTYTLQTNPSSAFTLNGTELEVDGTLGLAAGTHNVVVRATDSAGNFVDQTIAIDVVAQPTVGNNGGNAAGEAVTGTFTADNIDAGAGADTISTGFGEDTVTTGDGADVIQDTAENLNGDTFTDFDDEDEIVFTGAQFDADDLTFTAGAGGAPSTLAIDSDGDGTADTTITLNEALTGGNFLVFQQGTETKVSYEQSLLALGEGTSIATDAENGIVSQSFLTGDGTNTYNVSLDSARSGAGAKNLLGVYEVDATGDIVDVKLVFADTSVSTDPSFTITGVDAGNKLGFFLVFDGADLVTNAATDAFDFVPANGAAGDANISAGTALDLTINGTVVSNNIFHSFDTTLNSDGVQHAVSGVQADGNGIDIGFEDLFGGGDRDYQDVVFSVDIV